MSTATPTSQFLTTLDAARLAGKSTDTIRLWARTGRLPAIRTVSGQRLFRPADVRAAAARRSNHGRDDDGE